MKQYIIVRYDGTMKIILAKYRPNYNNQSARAYLRGGVQGVQTPPKFSEKFFLGGGGVAKFSGGLRNFRGDLRNFRGG